MSPTDSFEGLWSRLRAADAAAAAEVFRRYARRLTALARTRLHGRLRQKVDPEDVVQSVFLSFFPRVAEGEWDFGGWDSLWAMLALLTWRKCNRQVERYAADKRDLRREAAAPAAADSDSAWQPPAHDPRPDEEACLTETLECLMRGLKERERHILQLHLQGYSAAEISAQVGRAECTVKWVLKGVEEKLKRLADGPAPEA